MAFTLKAEQPSQLLKSNIGDNVSDNLDDWKIDGSNKQPTQEQYDEGKRILEGTNQSEYSPQMEIGKGDPNKYLIPFEDKAKYDYQAKQLENYLGGMSGTDFFKQGLSQMYGKDYDPFVEKAVEEHPEEVKEIAQGTPLVKEAEQITDGDSRNDEVNNEAVKETPEAVKEEILENTDSDKFINGMLGYNSLDDLDSAAQGFGYNIDDYDVYKDTDDIGEYYYALRKAIQEGDAETVEAITEEHPDVVENAPELDNTPLEEEAEQITDDTDNRNDEVNNEAVKETLGLLGDDFDFESFAQDAQNEYDKEEADRKARDKANKEALGTGRGTQGMKMPSTGMLGGRHWYDVSPDTLSEYTNQLIEDGEGLLGMASQMGRQLSDSDSWNSMTRGQVGAVSTHGNGLIKRGKRLQAVGNYLQGHGINPAELEPSTRKAILGIPLPGDKYNRNGTQEEYEHNLDVILNIPSEAPSIIEKTVIAPIEHEMDEPIPEEIKSIMVEEPQFTEDLIDWDNVEINGPSTGMGWNNGRVSDVDLNGPDFPVDNMMEIPETQESSNDKTLDVIDNDIPDPEPLREDETVISESSEIPVNEDDFEKVEGYENIDNVVQLKAEEMYNDVMEDDTIPEEEKEDTIMRRAAILDWFRRRSLSSPSVSSSKQDKVDFTRNIGSSAGLGNMANLSMPSGSVSNGNVGSGSVKEDKGLSHNAVSKAGGGSIPSKVGSTGNLSSFGGHANGNNLVSTSGNGGVSSGSVNHSGGLKITKQPLPSGEEHTQTYEGQSLGGGTNNLKEATVSNLEARLNECDPAWLAQFDINKKYGNWAYKGTPIDKLSGQEIAEVNEIVDLWENIK